MSISKTGDYAVLADTVRAQREEARRRARAHAEYNAHALTAIATDLQRLLERAQAIPGTYRVWAHITDAQSLARELATEWEKPST